MGILDRLGNLLKSYLDEEGRLFRGGETYRGPEDPDLGAAWEELEGFLRDGRGGQDGRRGDWSNPGSSRRGNSQGDWSGPGAFRREETAPSGDYPAAIRAAFAELGLEPGAPEEACKSAYKGLLKLHHPDRHGGHPGNMKKATEKTARLNAAYDKIERWRKTGAAD
jgi:DnaJ-domain-containing protein 1